MPRRRHSSSESSSDESSDNERARRGQQSSQVHSRSQRQDSSDSSPELRNARRETIKTESKRSQERKRYDSGDSDSSPAKGKRDGSKGRQSGLDRKRESKDRSKRRKRSTSEDSSESLDRRKRSRNRSSSTKRSKSRASPYPEKSEPISPPKPVLASRVNYMKSLNPDRSKRVKKEKSPSRRQVASLADDYKRSEKGSGRWGIMSLEDDYKRDRYRGANRDDRERRNRDDRSPRRRSPRRSPERRERSPRRQSSDRSPRRRSPDRRGRSPQRQSPRQSPDRRDRSPQRQSPRRSPDRRDRSPQRQSPRRSPNRRERSSQRQSTRRSPHRRERSPQRSSPNRSPQRKRSNQRSPDKRSGERRKSPKARSSSRSPKRQSKRSQERQYPPERQRSPVRAKLNTSSTSRRSPLRESPPVRERSRSPKRKLTERDRSLNRQRSPARGRSPLNQSSPVRERYSAERSSLERNRVPMSSNERLQDRPRSPPPRHSSDRSNRRSPDRLNRLSPDRLIRSPDRHSSYSKRSLDRQMSTELQSPVKRGSSRKAGSLRQLSEERLPPRGLSPERIPVDRDRRRSSLERIPSLLDLEPPVERRLSRPLGRRRSEERLVTRLSPLEPSFLDRPLRRSLMPDERTDRTFGRRSSLERSLDQRYAPLSPPRYLDRLEQPRPRTRARSLERTSRLSDYDRYPTREPRIPSLLEVGMFDRHYRRDGDRSLYDDLPDPLRTRSPPPPVARRWRNDLDYPPLDRYPDDTDILPAREPMDLPDRTVFTDSDPGGRVARRDDAVEKVPFRYRDLRGPPPPNMPGLRGRRPRRNDDRFTGRQEGAWRGKTDNRRLSETQWMPEEHERTVQMTDQSKRRRLDSGPRTASLSPGRSDRRRNRSFGSQDDFDTNAYRSRSPSGLDIDGGRRQISRQRSLSGENRTDRQQTNEEDSSSDDDEEQSPVRTSKISSTVTMVTKKRKKSRSPVVRSRSPVSGSRSPSRKLSRDRNRSVLGDEKGTNQQESASPHKSRMQKSSLSPQGRDKSAKKQSKSPRGLERTKLDDEEAVSEKKSTKSPRKKSRKDQKQADTNSDARSVSSKHSSNKRSRSSVKGQDSDSEPEESFVRSRSREESPRERIGSFELGKEDRVYEMECRESFVSEERSRNLEHMDSFASEQDTDRSREMERMDSFVSEEYEGSPGRRKRFDSEQDWRDQRDENEEGELDRHDLENYQSGPESGELTDSGEETEKRNALIKSLVNKPSLEELPPEEEERQRLEDEQYLAEKRQQALERLEAQKETVASQVVMVTDNQREKGDRSERREGRKGKEDRARESKRKRHTDETSSKQEASQPETEPVPKKSKPDPTGVEALTMRTGGAYIPPAKLRAMQESITDKSSVAYQRMSWEALKKSINGLINKVNVSNIEFIVRELFQENIVRGRGLMARSIIQAQAASPTFTHVYAALVAIVNTKFPQNGELVLRRLVIQFRRGFKRNDKNICLSTTRFIAHLVNQQVAHEVLALEILTLLLETPTDDAVEIVVGFLKESGQKLTEVTPRGINAIFERLRNVLHEGQIEQRVQYMVEVMFAVRKDGFKDHPSVIEELDLVEEEDQFTHLLTLEDAGDPENMLNIFRPDPDFLENEEKYKILKKEILDEGSSDEEEGGESGSESDSEDSEEEAEGEKQTIIDNTETNMVALRRTIYLTIQSSLDFEECAHKLMKMELKPGQESELCYMVLDCCAQMRTYEKFYGLLAQRFCMIDKKYIEPFQTMFKEQYDTIHRLETNKLRNVAKFFAHLLHTDAISWGVLSCIRLNEDDTSSASRIFIKILMQELSEYMGLSNLNERLKDPTLQEYFDGLMPRDNPRNTRFAINFFTTIGLGGLTDDLRDHLKTVSKKLMEQKQQEQEVAESSSSSETDSSTSESSSEESSGSSEDERRKKKNKGKERKEKGKNKKDKQGKQAVSNGNMVKEKRGKKPEKNKLVTEEDVQIRAERLRQLANYNAKDNRDVEHSRGGMGKEDERRSRGRKDLENLGESSGEEYDNRQRNRSVETGARSRHERNFSENENYQESDKGRARGYRGGGRRDGYNDLEGARSDRGDRFNDRGDNMERRGRNMYRNLDTGGDRRQKRDFDSDNFRFRNHGRGDGRMNRNTGRNRSEEHGPRMGRDDRRDDRRRRH